MELWIRSQDRTNLIKVERILCEEYAISNISAKNYKLRGFTKDYNSTIATYTTKERALEVLDEIQRLITPTINWNPIIKHEIKPEDTYTRTTFERYEQSVEVLPYYVYEMPKE